MKLRSFTSSALGLSLVATLSSGCKNNSYLYPKDPVPSPSTAPAVAEEATPPPAPPETRKKTAHVQKAELRDKLDIIWVIDNSQSMQTAPDGLVAYRKYLRDNFALFLDEFSWRMSFKWRMGILSTDYFVKPFAGFTQNTRIDHESKDPVGRFRDALQRLEVIGDGNEQTFNPVTRALENHPDFLRPNSYLALIVISDEPEQSAGFPPHHTPRSFVESLKKIRQGNDDLSVYVVHGGQEYCGPFGGSWNPERCTPLCYRGGVYEELVRLTRGWAMPICQGFGQELLSIARDISAKMEQFHVHLERRPVVSTIKVVYRGRELPGGPSRRDGYWQYDVEGNSLNFHDSGFVSRNDLDIEISYEVAERN